MITKIEITVTTDGQYSIAIGNEQPIVTPSSLKARHLVNTNLRKMVYVPDNKFKLK